MVVTWWVVAFWCSEGKGIGVGGEGEGGGQGLKIQVSGMVFIWGRIWRYAAVADTR